MGTRKVQSLIETGSQVSIINVELFKLLNEDKKINIQNVTSNLKIKTANRSELNCMGYCQIHITIKGEEIKYQAVIISEHIDDKYEAIIGTNILEKIEKYIKICQLKCEEKLSTRNLNMEHINKLNEVLEDEKEVFSKNDVDIGWTDRVKHHIELINDVSIKKPYRRIPPKQLEKVRELIDKLLEAKVIEESRSHFVSPIVLVKKKSGELRLCIDYRDFNTNTVKDAYPLPRIIDSFYSLIGSQYFTTLDLQSAYNQIEIEKHDKEKTAFCTPFGFFQYKRMPFGLCNGPATF